MQKSFLRKTTIWQKLEVNTMSSTWIWITITLMAIIIAIIVLLVLKFLRTKEGSTSVYDAPGMTNLPEYSSDPSTLEKASTSSYSYNFESRNNKSQEAPTKEINIFCPECGAKISDNKSRFCPYCAGQL